MEDNEAAVPKLINELLPVGLKGLMFAAFFAALMSSVDSYLNSFVTVFLGDFYRPVYQLVKQQPLGDRAGLYLGRILTAAVLIGGAIYAPQFKNRETLYDDIQTLLSIFNGPTLAILLTGIFWRGATAWGGLAGLTCGAITAFILNLLGGAVFLSDDTAYLYVSFWSFWISLTVTTVVSLFSKKKSNEELEGLVYGSVVKNRLNGNQ
jgi:Na+/proline symporter